MVRIKTRKQKGRYRHYDLWTWKEFFRYSYFFAILSMMVLISKILKQKNDLNYKASKVLPELNQEKHGLTAMFQKIRFLNFLDILLLWSSSSKNFVKLYANLLHQMWSFPLRNISVNMTKSTITFSEETVHGKPHFLLQRPSVTKIVVLE